MVLYFWNISAYFSSPRSWWKNHISHISRPDRTITTIKPSSEAKLDVNEKSQIQELIERGDPAYGPEIDDALIHKIRKDITSLHKVLLVCNNKKIYFAKRGDDVYDPVQIIEISQEEYLSKVFGDSLGHSSIHAENKSVGDTITLLFLIFQFNDDVANPTSRQTTYSDINVLGKFEKKIFDLLRKRTTSLQFEETHGI